MALRNEGLLFGTTRVEVQQVRASHRKLCKRCAHLPGERRLSVREGSGRAAVEHVLCWECGQLYLHTLNLEVERAIQMLVFGETDDGGPVRIDSEIRKALKAKQEKRR